MTRANRLRAALVTTLAFAMLAPIPGIAGGGPTITDMTLSVNGSPPATSVLGICSLGDLLSFDGTGFTTDMTVRLIGSDAMTEIPCVLDSDLTTPTTAYCLTEIGLPALTYTIEVDVEGSTAQGTDTYQYPIAPQLDFVWGCVDISPNTIDCPIGPTAFPTTIYLLGQGLVPDPTVSFGGDPVPVIYQTPTELKTFLPQKSGKDIPIRVSMGCLQSQPVLLSYEPPSISLIQSGACVPGDSPLEIESCPRVGGVLLEITGSGFTFESEVLVGGRPCTSVMASGSTGLTCSLPSGVGRQRVTVVTANQISTEEVNVGYQGCSAGQFSNGLTCSDCDAGFFSSSGDATACTPCPEGYFTDASGANQCTPCPPGKFQDSAGQQACDPCPVGRWSGEGYSACASCRTGHYANSTGSITCEPCDPGSFQDQEGQSTCQPCPIGEWSGEGFPICVASCSGSIVFLDDFATGDLSMWTGSVP